MSISPSTSLWVAPKNASLEKFKVVFVFFQHFSFFNFRFLDYSKKDLIPLIPDEGELEDGTKRNIKIISKPSTSWDTSQSFVISNFISDAKNMFKDLESEDYSKVS